MFDYHLHSDVSFDGVGRAYDMAIAAKEAGLAEICFTDHCDYNSDKKSEHFPLDLNKYSAAYDGLEIKGLKIKKGVEFGMTDWNRAELSKLLSKRGFDFVIGSVHFVDGFDPYGIDYWAGKTEKEAYGRYLEEILRLVKIHSDFDVLGHLTYVSRSIYNPTKNLLRYSDYRELTDEIFSALIKKDKGIEINTSGVNLLGEFIPSYDFVKRFKELGGKIITVGSDAHAPERVGQHTDKAMEIAKEIFGYVCTFEKRKPIFNKL